MNTHIHTYALARTHKQTMTGTSCNAKSCSYGKSIYLNAFPVAALAIQYLLGLHNSLLSLSDKNRRTLYLFLVLVLKNPMHICIGSKPVFNEDVT